MMPRNSVRLHGPGAVLPWAACVGCNYRSGNRGTRLMQSVGYVLEIGRSLTALPRGTISRPPMRRPLLCRRTIAQRMSTSAGGRSGSMSRRNLPRRRDKLGWTFLPRLRLPVLCRPMTRPPISIAPGCPSASTWNRNPPRCRYCQRCPNLPPPRPTCSHLDDDATDVQYCADPFTVQDTPEFVDVWM